MWINCNDNFLKFEIYEMIMDEFWAGKNSYITFDKVIEEHLGSLVYYKDIENRYEVAK